MPQQVLLMSPYVCYPCPQSGHFDGVQARSKHLAHYTLTAQCTAEGRATNGPLLFQEGPFTATGTRIEAEPIVPFGSPVAGTPTA